MIIRNGFVSNSSSSSFLLRGGTIMHAPQEIVDNIDKFNTIYIVGDLLSTGYDIFELDWELKNIVKHHSDRFIKYAKINYAFGNPDESRSLSYEEEKVIYRYDDDDNSDEEWDEIEIEDMKRGIFQKDYSSSDAKYEFVKRYLLNPDEASDVYNAEWVEDSNRVRKNIIVAYKNKYEGDEIKNHLDEDLTLVKNEFSVEFYDFVPYIYMNIKNKKVDVDNLKEGVVAYSNFRVLDFKKINKPVDEEFRIAGYYGIINKASHLKDFYKEAEDEIE